MFTVQIHIKCPQEQKANHNLDNARVQRKKYTTISDEILILLAEGKASSKSEDQILMFLRW
jgi:hypothetical protein